jgi:hypothetical protein
MLAALGDDFAVGGWRVTLQTSMAIVITALGFTGSRRGIYICSNVCTHHFLKRARIFTTHHIFACRDNIEHYKFIPFSMGPRTCPGYSFAKVSVFLQVRLRQLL